MISTILHSVHVTLSRIITNLSSFENISGPYLLSPVLLVCLLLLFFLDSAMVASSCRPFPTASYASLCSSAIAMGRLAGFSKFSFSSHAVTSVCTLVALPMATKTASYVNVIIYPKMWARWGSVRGATG